MIMSRQQFFQFQLLKTIRKKILSIQIVYVFLKMEIKNNYEEKNLIE